MVRKAVAIIACIFTFSVSTSVASDDRYDDRTILEKLPVPEELTPFIQDGKVSIFSRPRATGKKIAVDYEFNQVNLMLQNNIPAMMFEFTNGNPKDFPDDYFKGTYRILYMTKPLVGKSPGNSSSKPEPPIYDTHKSNVYVMGILVTGSKYAPRITPWIDVSTIDLMIDD